MQESGSRAARRLARDGSRQNRIARVRTKLGIRAAGSRQAGRRLVVSAKFSGPKKIIQLGEDLLGHISCGPSWNFRASHQAVTRLCHGTRLPRPWKPRCPPRRVSTVSIIGRRGQSIAV